MFAIINKKDNEFRFHINTLTDFLAYLKRSNVYDKDIEVIDIPKNEGLSVNLKMKSHFKPRDYQEPIIEYFESAKSTRGINKGNLIKQNFIGIQTGEGKTLTSSFCAVKYGKRILICVRPLFMKKWAQDIFEIFKVKKEETISVQGGDQLKGLISIAKEPAFKKVKIILLSLPTLRNWFTSYETLGSKEIKEHYGIEPDEFYEHMGVGLRLIDEVHIDFHFNFLHDLYTNVEKTISLSATLLNLNKFMESMYQIAYPKEERYNGGALKKYTRAFAVMYNIQYQRRINTTEWGSNMYSHIAFEKSIMNKKNGTLGNNYCGMIVDILGIKFLPTFKKGNKAVIYAASKKMCSYIADFIKRELPDYDVRRYIEGDPYENLLEADIRVTTLQSGGTGHDIKGLTDVILTNCIQSIQQNIQVLGRLREIPDGETRFYYLTCYTIPKQMQYHQQKMVMLRQRAKSIEILPYGLTL
jgi:superfamily II DNA or RNA helicase